MGNSSSTRQKVHNIIENNIEVDLQPQAIANCTQRFVFNVDEWINCGFNATQECSSFASASFDAVMAAISKASAEEVNEQEIEGLALGMNVSDTSQDMKSEIIAKLRATCASKATVEPLQEQTLNIRRLVCEPGEDPVFTFYQYGDAGADCVVNTLVDASAEGDLKADNKQKNEGLDLVALASSLMALTVAGPILIVLGILLLVYLISNLISSVFSGNSDNAQEARRQVMQHGQAYIRAPGGGMHLVQNA